MSPFEIIDAQLHEPAIRFDWSGTDPRVRRRVLDEVLVATMDAVGVDGAVLFPADTGWATELAAALPHRFRVVPPLAPGGHLRGFTPDGVVNELDPLAPDIPERIKEFAARHPCAGFRMMDRRTLPESVAGRESVELFAPVLQACEDIGVAIFLSAAGDRATPRAIARAHPQLTVVIDHLGLRQPPTNPRDVPPFRELDSLLALAAEPNIALKATGVPTLSEAAYPFADLWPSLRRLLDAFGADRLMWGSDISRIQGRIGHDLRILPDYQPYHGLHTYSEAVHYVRDSDQLTAAEKAALLGGTVRRLLGWPAEQPARLTS
ncbi:amidohydrolase family protein [Pseudonocardia sp. CA-107938]|uniref:amidohydrolase family protein n=1 Tax=Pseudonocardia sp. CA-107938 TaxID=3240021 RepID=UPI003D936484